MTILRIHHLSGYVITTFVGLHLFNHVWGVLGAEAHIEMMNGLRTLYRNTYAEVLLLGAVLIQVLTGSKLFLTGRIRTGTAFEKLHLWTGLYLALFLVVHVSAVLIGRYFLQLDTNFYFGVAGLNTFPLNLFYIPYYGLAILSFFGHVAAIHRKRMKTKLMGLSPEHQAMAILFLGLVATVVIFYGSTNGFKGVKIPEAYEILCGVLSERSTDRPTAGEPVST